MRVIITGPTGAIGVALIQECLEHQIEVLAICHRGSKRISYLPTSPYISILELDLNEYKSFQPDDDKTKYDVFYHLAWCGTVGNARNDMELQQRNIAYSLDAVCLAHRLGCHTFIGAGSQAECGRVSGKISAQTPAFPENGYGIAKLCAGQMTRIMCQQFNIKHIWTRILSVYGPYDGENSMIISTIKKILSGEIPQFTKGEQKWDYLYSKDAARAMYLLAEKGKKDKIYCIGSGKTKTLLEYIELLKNEIDPFAQLGIGAIPYVEGQVMYLCADIDELKKDTGFEVEMDFKNGIHETVKWVKNMMIK